MDDDTRTRALRESASLNEVYALCYAYLDSAVTLYLRGLCDAEYFRAQVERINGWVAHEIELRLGRPSVVDAPADGSGAAT